jgi:hypothetical protein
MNDVRIGFSRSHGPVGWAIRFMTRSSVNHTFFVVNVDGRDMVVGADGNGFVMQSFERFRGNHEVCQVFGSRDLGVDLDEGGKFLLDSLDEGYDYVGLFGMLFVTLGRWLHRHVRNPFGSVSKLFCSEAASEMLAAIGFPDAKVLDPHSTDPGTLLRFLEQRVAFLESLAARV